MIVIWKILWKDVKIMALPNNNSTYCIQILCVIICIFIFKAIGQCNGDRYSDLYQEYASRFNFDSKYLKYIAVVESRENPLVINFNKKEYMFDSVTHAISFLDENNLTRFTSEQIDIGLMQINSQWFKKADIPLYTGFYPDVSVFLASVLLREIFDRHGVSLQSVGYYHSPKEHLRKKYISRIWRVLENDQ